MTPKLKLALLLLASAHALSAPAPVLAAEPPALGDRVPLSGRIFTDAYAPSRNPLYSRMNEVSASFFLQADPKLSEPVTSRLIFEGQEIGTSATQSAQFRSTLREGYVDYARGSWQMRVGKLIQPWGKSDAVNPTDFLSSKDFARFNPDEEIRRTGNTELNLKFAPVFSSGAASPWSIELRWAPVPAQSRMLIPSSSLPSGVTIQDAAVTPPASLANSDVALRTSYAGDGWDASLSAFRGLTKMPEFSLISVGGTLTSPVITAARTFQRQRALGGDFSWTPARTSWILRGEAAYFWTDNGSGDNPAMEPAHFDSVLGAERPLGSDFRIQLQGLWRLHPRLRAPESAPSLAQQQLARANAQILAYQFRSRPGASLRLSYSRESSGFDAEVFLLGNFAGGDYLIRPKLSYAWTDAFRTTLGSDYYGGPANRTLGALRAYNSLFAEAKVTF